VQIVHILKNKHPSRPSPDYQGNAKLTVLQICAALNRKSNSALEKKLATSSTLSDLPRFCAVQGAYKILASLANTCFVARSTSGDKADVPPQVVRMGEASC